MKEKNGTGGPKKNSCARAFLECLICDAWYCTTQNRGGKKNPLTQKRKEWKEIGKGRVGETGEHGTRQNVSGVQRAYAHVHPLQLPSRPAHVGQGHYHQPAPSWRADVWRSLHGQRQRDGEHICRCGRGRQGRERGKRESDGDGDPGDVGKG